MLVSTNYIVNFSFQEKIISFSRSLVKSIFYHNRQSVNCRLICYQLLYYPYKPEVMLISKFVLYRRDFRQNKFPPVVLWMTALFQSYDSEVISNHRSNHSSYRECKVHPDVSKTPSTLPLQFPPVFPYLPEKQ